MLNKKGVYVLTTLAVIALAFFVVNRNSDTTREPQTNTPDTETPGSVESVEGITVPEGFNLKIFAKDIPGARDIEMGQWGSILVSQASEGKIVSLTDTDNDGVSDETKVLASGLNNPHGLATWCEEPSFCSLFVAESNALYGYLYDTGVLSKREKLLDLPAGSVGTHFTRSLLFLPWPQDNILLISIGSSCNVCDESDERRASIISYDIETGKSEIYAKGLRNSVFMTLNPVDGKVFATEMGRDNLGDDIPPDEINIIEKGKNYGWPICYGKNIHDTQFDKKTYIRNPCMAPFETPSLIDLQAHSAPLGLGFIPEEGWPEDYWYDLLVAYHGSWNRSVPTGYKIVRLKMNASGQYQGTEDFITGWFSKGSTDEDAATGRPVDIKVLSGGVAYISDDKAGVIYRFSRN